MPGNKKWIKELWNFQFPSDQIRMHLTAGIARKSVQSYLKKAHVLGSDCHGAHHRVRHLQDGHDIFKDIGTD